MLVYPPKYLVSMLAPYVDKQALREGKVSERLIKAMHIARYYEVAVYYNLLIRGTRVYIAPSIINGATGNNYPEVSVEGSAATYGIEGYVYLGRYVGQSEEKGLSKPRAIDQPDIDIANNDTR